jgi:hypothetical protein
MEQLIGELKEHLIEELNLEEITPEDIDSEDSFSVSFLTT